MNTAPGTALPKNQHMKPSTSPVPVAGGQGGICPQTSLRQLHWSVGKAGRGTGRTGGTFWDSPSPRLCCWQSWLHRGLGVCKKSGQKSPGSPQPHWSHRPRRGDQEGHTSPRDSGEDGFLPPLLGEDGTRLVLGVGVVGQLGWAGGHRAFQDGLLQVVEDGRVLLGEEGDGYAALPRSACPPDAVDVICRGAVGSGRASAQAALRPGSPCRIP